MTPDTLLLPPSFSSLAAALVFASGSQGRRAWRMALCALRTTPPQKLLIITAKRKKSGSFFTCRA
jgi:hypothetical protein